MAKFVFTGPAQVKGMKIERKYLIDLARTEGHIVQAKVDSLTDFLVCDDNPKSILPHLRTTKQTQAVFLGVPVITSETFLKKMGYL